MKLLCLAFLAATALASLTFDDGSRLHLLTTKVFCNCGCGEILSECSHPECKRRVPLNHEIASAVRNGKTDAEILGDLEKKYGATILLVPSFGGFNVLLWIVPIAGGLIALGVVVWRRCSFASGARSR
jgi:cytochrome c-type biogenesis protein CcmH/NrfF